MYSEESEIGEGPAVSEAPFKDKSTKECYQILRAMRLETRSNIQCPNFIVMDERSLRDGTVLLVAGSVEHDGEFEEVRADFELAYYRLSIYFEPMEGDGMKEDQAAAHATVDGVLRADAIRARRLG